MPKRITPLSDTKIRTITPAEKPQKLFDGGGLFSWSRRPAASYGGSTIVLGVSRSCWPLVHTPNYLLPMPGRSVTRQAPRSPAALTPVTPKKPRRRQVPTRPRPSRSLPGNGTPSFRLPGRPATGIKSFGGWNSMSSRGWETDRFGRSRHRGSADGPSED